MKMLESPVTVISEGRRQVVKRDSLGRHTFLDSIFDSEARRFHLRFHADWIVASIALFPIGVENIRAMFLFLVHGAMEDSLRSGMPLSNYTLRQMIQFAFCADFLFSNSYHQQTFKLPAAIANPHSHTWMWLVGYLIRLRFIPGRCCHRWWIRHVFGSYEIEKSHQLSIRLWWCHFLTVLTFSDKSYDDTSVVKS